MTYVASRTDHPLVIAIDGPSGSGKSSTARGVAQRLGLAYLDTGAMYRAAAVVYRDRELRPDEGERMAALVADAGLRVATDPQAPSVVIDGSDVTDEIRTPGISEIVSQVATMIPVRRVLQRMQREIIAAAGRRIVVEGRDITTVVAPDAELRLLLVADPEARMNRRNDELNGSLSAEQIADQILRRDRDDSTVSQFSEAADGVIVIDSTHLGLQQVIDAIVVLAKDTTKE